MHPEFDTLLAEHAAPAKASTRDIHDMARPLMAVIGQAQQQVTVYRAQLLDAKLAPHDPIMDGYLERLKQKLMALEQTLPAFLQAGERIADAFTQFDRIMGEAKGTVVKMQAEAEAKAAVAAGNAGGVRTP